MVWPAALVAELASRRCLIFLGAGASAGAVSQEDGVTRPPLWPAFIATLVAAAPAGTNLAAVNGLLAKDRYLDAAEILLAKIAAADFTRVVREKFVRPRFANSPIHLSVLNIDPKVVVTTNYDDIYDTFCRTGQARDGYNVCRYYESHLVNDLRSPVRLIVKAHGCVADPARIVLSRSQYFKERQLHAGFYNVLDALFITHTILFVGYSMSDPDIQLVLENSNISATSSHTHYALVEDSIQPDIEDASRRAYNIHFIKYPAGQHQEAARLLADLEEQVTQFRVANPG